MQIIVKTENGTQYKFTHRNGRTFFSQGLFSGEVIRMNNGDISVGKIIDMDYRKGIQCDDPDEIMMFVRTTPVVEIRVIL